MKKLLFTVLALIPIFSYAQELGVKAGFTVADGKINYSDKYQYVWYVNSPTPYEFGYGAGLDLGLVFSYGKKLFLQLEPSFTEKNTINDFDYTDAKGNSVFAAQTKFPHSYLTIPVLANYAINKEKHFGITLGLQPEFLISDKRWAFAATSMQGEGFNGFGISAVGGFFVGINLSKKVALRFHSRYVLGLTDVYKSPYASGNFNYITIGTQFIYKLKNK